HPTYPDKKPGYPSTGYTIMPDDTGIISSFVFIDSSWIDRGRPISSVSSADREKVERSRNSLIGRYGEIQVSVVQNLSGRFEIHSHNGGVYFPVFEAVITVNQLKILAIELANYVAQPTIANWDGKTIRRLVA